MLRKQVNQTRRRGTVLVLFVLLLVVLLGMVGLVLDSGLMMQSSRHSQNVADSASLAAAMELMRGGTPDSARTVALLYARTHNGLSDATITVNIPPTSGPHLGDSRYVEVLIARPHQTVFVQITGVERDQQVRARAVAGYERERRGEGPIVLDPFARPGISVTGGGQLLVNGSVVVNSQGAGVDENNQPVDWEIQQYGLSTGNNATIKVRYLQIVGGVDVVENVQKFDPADPAPLFCRAPISPDPLRWLPTPQPGNISSILDWTRQNTVTVSQGETRTFSPGVYENIQINQGATVYFKPGVYVFSPTKPNQGLTMNGGCTVVAIPDEERAAGVMFYLTGSNYLADKTNPGKWDALDDAQNALDGPLPAAGAVLKPPITEIPLPNPPDPQFGKVDFAKFNCNATNAHVSLQGLKDPNSPFNGMLFFQRRRNTSTASIAGTPGIDVTLDGTIYAKWAQFSLAGGGVYNSVFVVGRIAVSGGATVVINNPGTNFGLANRVFLAE